MRLFSQPRRVNTRAFNAWMWHASCEVVHMPRVQRSAWAWSAGVAVWARGAHVLRTGHAPTLMCRQSTPAHTHGPRNQRRCGIGTVRSTTTATNGSCPSARAEPQIKCPALLIAPFPAATVASQSPRTQSGCFRHRVHQHTHVRRQERANHLLRTWGRTIYTNRWRMEGDTRLGASRCPCALAAAALQRGERC